MPVYNGAKYIRVALDSILQQDYSDFELIISDNASTDETASICLQYAATDGRIRYFRNESNVGAAKNYQKVFQLARSKLFKWATHDDIQLPGFLRRCVEVIEKAPPSVVLVAPKTEIIDEEGKKIAEDWYVESIHTRHARPHRRVADVLLNVDWATAQFGLFRTEALRKTRLIDNFVACDYVLLLEVAILGEIWEIPEIMFQRRYHSEISTRVNRTQAEFLQWFDPSQKAKCVFFPRMRSGLKPRMRLGLEYARSIWRMPIPNSERVLCTFAALFIWTARESKRLGREYKGSLQNKLTKALAVFRDG
jgi:glycosyltransferase involved in cell wall biosynthesis